MYAIGEKVEVIISRSEANFDKACEEAYRYALRLLGVDDCGHIRNVTGAERSSASVVVEFKRYRHIGQDFEYLFDARVDQNDEDEES